MSRGLSQKEVKLQGKQKATSKPKTIDQTVIEISPDTVEKKSLTRSKKKVHTLTSVLTARSKVMMIDENVEFLSLVSDSLSTRLLLGSLFPTLMLQIRKISLQWQSL